MTTIIISNPSSQSKLVETYAKFLKSIHPEYDNETAKSVGRWCVLTGANPRLIPCKIEKLEIDNIVDMKCMEYISVA